MTPTVEKPASIRPVVSSEVDPSSVVESINKEIVPCLEQVRTALNLQGVSAAEGNPFRATTVLAAYKLIWTQSMFTGAAWHVRADVVGKTDTTSQVAAYTIVGTFKQTGGTAAQVGSTTVVHAGESAAAIDVKFTVSGAAVQIEARDDGVSLMSFKPIVTITEF